MSVVDTLKLCLLDKEIARCEEALRVAKLAKTEHLIAFCEKHPLSQEFIAKAALRVRDGGALCCEAGLAWLRTEVGDVWAPILNDWAYEALSCSETREDRLAGDSVKVVDRWTALDFAEKRLRAQLIGDIG